MAGEGKGWISLYRSIQDHWLWQEKPFDKARAWLDLLLSANHQDKKVLLGNELIIVKRGGFVTSQKKLMDRWGWGSEKTRTFLKLLDSDGMIRFQPDKKKTTITILNYDSYQNQNGLNADISMDSENMQNDNRTQTECKQNDNRTSAETNNNVNNDNNDNKYSSCSKNLLQEIVNYYSTKAGVLELNMKPKEIQSIMALIKNIPVEVIKEGIDKAFNNYKPQCEGDKIKSFLYCEPVVKMIYTKKLSKKGESKVEKHKRDTGEQLRSEGIGL